MRLFFLWSQWPLRF